MGFDAFLEDLASDQYCHICGRKRHWIVSELEGFVCQTCVTDRILEKEEMGILGKISAPTMTLSDWLSTKGLL